MLDILAGNPVLTVFLVIALGSLFGMIPFGPIRFGPAGALFVGLALSVLDPRLGEGLALVRTIGLALFVYTVGLAAGPTLIRNFRRQAPMMLGSAAVLLLVGVAIVVAGTVLGVDGGFLGGAFAGVGTSTPALAAATQTAGNDDPAVGYALTYPIGVVLGILAVYLEMGRKRKSPKDKPSAATAGLTDLTVVVERQARLIDVPGASEGLVRFSFWSHDGAVEVAEPRETVEPGERVVIVGSEDAVAQAVRWLGHRAHTHLAHDRTEVDFRRLLLSKPTLSGRSIADLDIAGRFGGIVTRVKRGDLDLLARDDLHVQLGDRLRVVVPRGRMSAVGTYLGDTERGVSQVNAVSLGLGLSLGFLLGLVSLPLGSITLSLGVAAGPLVAGIVLGWRERTGPIVWSLPTGASDTLCQLGILLFLTGVGLSSGPALSASITDPVGVKLLVIGVLAALVGTVLLGMLGDRLGMSPTRGGGLIAGFIGNPSLLAFANTKAADERVNEGYATLFAVDQVLKVVLVQVLIGLTM
jgi:putative transport protein